MKLNMGSFVADGNAIDVNVGFVPDFVIAFEGYEETNPAIHYWSRDRIDAASALGQFGLIMSGTGTVTVHADADNGFAELDEATNKILLPAPDGDGERQADVPNPYTLARSSAATARSTTALGTVLKPSRGNETGYVYECTTAGTGSAEPDWPTVPGESITDGSTVFICREEKVVQGNVKGFTVGATISTDTDEWSWLAFAADKVNPDVDAASVDLV